MKIRNGFVSNSSSSSFICNSCGQDISGMNMDLEEAGMYECKKGHIFCESHFVGGVKNYYDLEHKERKEHCLGISSNIEEEIKAADEDQLDEIYNDISCEERYETSVENCPCCTLKDVTDEQMLSYLYFKLSTTHGKMVKEIQKKFANAEEMDQRLKK